MINKKDLNSIKVIQDLKSSDNTLCKTVITYTVRKYQKIENLKSTHSFLIECSQRIIVPNTSTFTPEVSTVNGFSSYPALINNAIDISFPSQGLSASNGTILLDDYSPKTLNSAVSTDASNSQEKGTSSTLQHTSGSSTSQTNSYGSSVDVGFCGGALNAGATFSHDQSNTSSTDSSRSTGSSQSSGSDSNRGASFSVKDWGSYAYTNKGNLDSINWVWAQEFPWNILNFRYSDNNNSNISLPSYVMNRLWNSEKNEALPPSHLSLFGTDFTMKSAWIVTPDQTDLKPTVNFLHTTRILNGTHGDLDGKGFSAQLNECPNKLIVKQDAVDLYKLALDPILFDGEISGDNIGFSDRKKFICAPDNGIKFLIQNNSNNLMVSGEGFGKDMIAQLGIGKATYSIEFKIIDLDSEISLYIKHWLTKGDSCRLELVINENSDSPLIKHVNSLEGKGGDDNMMDISLRNFDAGSIDYHDYLQLGYNRIDVTVTPSLSPGECNYQLRAIAIK